MDFPHADARPTGQMDQALPANVILGEGSRICADAVTQRAVFARLRSRRSPAVHVGRATLIDGVMFNLGENAFVQIGNGCHLTECFLIANQEIRMDDNVVIGWHATVVDSDFHPVPPSERESDVLALSPLTQGLPRHYGVNRPVVIERNVWIGPLAVILKGVRIGAGAVIEPGAVVTRDVPPGARMLGNPAQNVTSDDR